MKKRKLKLKKQAYYVLAGIMIIAVSIILGMNYYNDYQYKKTTEYKLVEKGYTIKETTKIQEKLKEEEINKILEKEKNDLILKLLEEKYFLMKNLDTYIEYQKKEEEKELKDIVAIVNTHANNKWYQKELETDYNLKEKMNVNKFYALKSDYTPENLIEISLNYSYGKNKLIDYAYEKFIELWNAAKEEDIHLMVNSSYRDYEEQKNIYEDYKASRGEKKADEIAAHPGHSEHQTGLVVDMTSKNAPEDFKFKESEEYKWLKENAHKYGFIERYPEGKTFITGYSPESWHWRYVGIDAATVIYNENITYDEYYAYYIEK